MTIYELEILFHHHCSSERFPGDDAPAFYPTVDGLIGEGLMARCEQVGEGPEFFVTEKGRALIMMVCQTPLPETWLVDPRTGKKVEEVR